jgi:outer membrane protein assembly factor BamB
MNLQFRSCAFLLIAVGALNFANGQRAGSAQAADWPQWRGPNRDGISTETGLLKEWPKEGPPLSWKIDNAGSGYSAPAIVGDRLYILANEGTEHEFVQAHNAKDGQRLWRTPLGKVGPNLAQMNYAAARSTPTVDGDLLYALGSDGDLACVDAATGKVRWQKNLRTDFGGKPGDWAYAESPLVDGERLICTPGGTQATLLALNKRAGDVIWKCATPEGDPAAFASAIVTEAAGVRQYVQLLQKGLAGVNAKSGKLLWRFAKATSPFNANIPTPLASDNFVYVASAGTGGGLVKLNPKDGGVHAEQVYFQSKLPTTIGGVVKVGPNLYGTTAQAMLCLDFASGNVQWEERALGAGSLCYAEGRIYVHGENGEVGLVEASAAGYHEKGRFTPLGQPEHSKPMEKAWAYPALANGHLFIRDHDTIWCYDVRAK